MDLIKINPVLAMILKKEDPNISLQEHVNKTLEAYLIKKELRRIEPALIKELEEELKNTKVINQDLKTLVTSIREVRKYLQKKK